MLRINNQQRDFLQVVVDRSPELGDVADLVRTALAAPAVPVPSSRTEPLPPPARTAVAAYTIAPGTGKAVPVRAGEVVRVSQIDGQQCVDMNVFNLNNRHERLHIGRTRGLQGPHPSTGDVLWSNAPWERPIMAILGSTTRTDTYFPFCSRTIYSVLFGLHDRTNCQEIQNEAQREYGLAPWEIHESLNLFMVTAMLPSGDVVIERNDSGPGDFIEFLALLDLLVVPNVCGDDVTNCSNYGMRPVRVTVERSRPEDRLAGAAARDKAVLFGLPGSRRLPAGEPLQVDAHYVPHFPHLPLQSIEMPVPPDDGRNEDQLREAVLGWAVARLGVFG
ncbi:urea carboxylase-associated family protein [Actinoplanes sp. N902-109]|uniref:DUF1989 domain-containing protein n=1 Tax=Actinoplanes sp. (strain N902-109) TaxID=649831 RepID=UPI000329555D|nr:urea carboxylase-associated family protein [Actinoplanes sp. N902-109]AGL17132.1 hypothetical protein L083_3622 [Actinoplanes sp. N902-109]